jgi:predicted DNA-binding protein (UPF0251 family)
MTKRPPLPYVPAKPSDMPPPRLSDPQFDALAQVSRLRAGSDKYCALYQVLVKGLTIGDAAKMVGVKYSSAWDAVEAAKINIKLCEGVVYPSK